MTVKWQWKKSTFKNLEPAEVKHFYNLNTFFCHLTNPGICNTLGIIGSNCNPQHTNQVAKWWCCVPMTSFSSTSVSCCNREWKQQTGSAMFKVITTQMASPFCFFLPNLFTLGRAVIVDRPSAWWFGATSKSLIDELLNRVSIPVYGEFISLRQQSTK